MAQRRRSSLALSGEQARQALAVLINDGKLAAGEVRNALKRHRHLVTDLKARLAALEEGLARVGTRVLKDGPVKTRVTKRQRKRRISAATRKLYQQQGRYMAALRNLSKEARAKVKAVREKSGVRAAIAAAKKMGK